MHLEGLDPSGLRASSSCFIQKVDYGARVSDVHTRDHAAWSLRRAQVLTTGMLIWMYQLHPITAGIEACVRPQPCLCSAAFDRK